MGNEHGSFREEQCEFLKLRLGLIANTPEVLAKIIYYNTNIAVAVFGGISVALAFLHGKDLLPLLNVILSIFVSLIGALIASMIIKSIVNAQRSAKNSNIEMGIILSMLDAKIYTGTSLYSTNMEVEDSIKKEKEKYKELMGSNNSKQLKTADWLRIIIEVMRVFMFICLTYSLMAFWFLICCPDVFKYIW